MRVRVLIIGGGIAGCAAAVELARRGAEVTVVDRDQPGTGATGASAGMLAPQYEAGGPGPGFRFALESKRLWAEFARWLEDLAQWPMGYATRGMLVANRTPEEEERARDDLSWQQEAGLRGEIFSPEAACRLHPGISMDFPSYTWLPDEALIDTQRLAVALADAVRGAGGQVMPARAVQGILSEGGRATGVFLEDGRRLSCDRVLLASGAWAPLLEGLPRTLPVRPVRGQILRLRPESPPDWPLLADHQGCYLVPRENGSLLVGSTMEEVGYDDGVTDEARAALIESALQLVPELEEARIVERWAGLRPLTPDTWPILGPDPAMEGLLYATGYGRNGILFAPLAARVLADLVLEGRSDVAWQSFGIERFLSPS